MVTLRESTARSTARQSTSRERLAKPILVYVQHASDTAQYEIQTPCDDILSPGYDSLQDQELVKLLTPQNLGSSDLPSATAVEPANVDAEQPPSSPQRQATLDRRESIQSLWSLDSQAIAQADHRSAQMIFQEALSKPEEAVGAMPTFVLGQHPTHTDTPQQNTASPLDAIMITNNSNNKGTLKKATASSLLKHNPKQTPQKKTQPSTKADKVSTPVKMVEDVGSNTTNTQTKTNSTKLSKLVGLDKLTREEKQMIKNLRRFCEPENDKTISCDGLVQMWINAGETDPEVHEEMLEDLAPLRDRDTGLFLIVEVAKFLSEPQITPRKLTVEQQSIVDHISSFSESQGWISEKELKQMWLSSAQTLTTSEVESLLDELPAAVRQDPRGRFSIVELAVLFS